MPDRSTIRVLPVAALILAVMSPMTGTSQPPASDRIPFQGAYVNLDQLFKNTRDVAGFQQAIRHSLDRFKASGLKVAMPYATSTSGSAYYPSRIIPVREYKEWDPFQFYFDEAHRRGLQVWSVVCVMPSGDTELTGILRQHPEWALLDESGKKWGYLSPFHPDVRQWIVSVQKEIVSRYHPDGILLDYLRFPNRPTFPDAASAARLKKEFPPFATGEPAEKKKQLQRLKERALTELAEQISRELRAIQPSIRIGLYSWGPHVLDSHDVAQDWRTWITRGYIDMVNVSGYCYRDNYKDRYMEAFSERMRGAARIFKETGTRAELTFTLGVKTSHGQVKDAAQIGEYLRAARQEGIPGVAFFTWSYLEPYLDEVMQSGYLKGAAPKP